MSCLSRPRTALFSFPRVSFLIAILLTTSLASANAQETVRIGGTGGALAVMKKLAAAFERSHHGVSITVLPSLGSSGGIRAVLAGALDLGVSSRPLKEKENGAVARAIGNSPFVFAVRKDTAVDELTIPEIEAMYAGRTRTWPDGRPVRVVLRPEAETDTALLKGLSPAMDRIVTEAMSREGMIMAVTDQDNAHSLEKVPGAIGTTTLAQIISEKLPFKALQLNGVVPGTDTLSAGTYPYFKTTYIVTLPGARPVVREFVDFILSARGRSILSRCGYQVIR